MDLDQLSPCSQREELIRQLRLVGAAPGFSQRPSADTCELGVPHPAECFEIEQQLRHGLGVPSETAGSALRGRHAEQSNGMQGEHIGG